MAPSRVEIQFGRRANATSPVHAQGASLRRVLELLEAQPQWHVLDVATGAGPYGRRAGAVRRQGGGGRPRRKCSRKLASWLRRAGSRTSWRCAPTRPHCRSRARASTSSPAASPPTTSPIPRVRGRGVPSLPDGEPAGARRQRRARSRDIPGGGRRRPRRRGRVLQQLREAARPEPRPLPRAGGVARAADGGPASSSRTANGSPRRWTSGPGPTAWALRRRRANGSRACCGAAPVCCVRFSRRVRKRGGCTSRCTKASSSPRVPAGKRRASRRPERGRAIEGER